MKQRIRYFCLTLLVMVAGLTSAQNPVAQIGETKYESLAEAVAAANAGDVIEIIKAGDYKLPNLPNNVTIEGTVEGVNIDANVPYDSSIASVPNGATFRNLTFNWNDVHYHGFQHAGTINMENCKHNGRFFSYGNMNFTNCEFEYNGDEYCMWVYGAGEVVYDQCTFTNNTKGKLLHLYCEGTSLEHKVTVKDCKFVNGGSLSKAAVNVKATNGSNVLQYELYLEGNNTYEGNFPTTVGEQANSDHTWILSRLAQVDDRKVNPDSIKVYENDKLIYPVSYVAAIGDEKYTTLEDAFAAVQNGEIVTLLDDVTLSGNLELALEGKSVTLDLATKSLNGRTNLKSGSLTVKNGTVNCEGGQPLNVYGSATAGAENHSVLTVAKNVTVTGAYGVCMFGPTASAKAGYGAVANIAGTLNGTKGTVFVSGNLGNNIAGDMKNVVNITGKINGNNDAGVALNGNATVNVKSGAEITGNTGIAVKRGVLNVEDGATIHATGAENLNPDPNNNGTEMTGAAISMTDTYNNYGAMSVNITGGTFTSDNTVALFKKEANYTNDATYSVSGGTFSTAVPAEFCAPGYEPKDLGNGQYSVYAPTYEVAIKSVTPKAESWYISGNANIQFVITKDGQAIATKLLNQEQLDKWDIILDENYLTLKSKAAAAKWLQYNFNVVGAGTTTIVFQNKANPEIKVEQEVSISHKLILTIQPAGTHMVEAGPVEIATNTKFDGVAIENFEDYTFTSSDESIATINGTKITPHKAGTITVTATKNNDQTASASANVRFVDAPAKIGEVYYESIGKAMEAAQSGQTITLLHDVTESYSFTGNQPRTNDFALTIDLNGHTWSGSAKPYTLRVDYGTITVKDSQGGGGVKYGSDYAFIVSHLASEYPSKLILENGTFTGKTSVAQVGYPGGSGSNKKYYGGDLVINGGTFVTVPDEGETYDENGNFKYTLNKLDMVESNYPGGIYSPSTITVNGGKFLKFDPQNNLAEGANTNFVPEGLVSTKSVEDGEAWYTISKIVAKIGETTYTTLADAFSAATEGQTITVLTDIDQPSTINVTKQVTLDLNGKTISNTADLWVGDNWSFFSVQANGNLTVTGNGTIDAKENDCYTFDVRDGGILTIKDGTFTGNISCVYLYNKENIGVSTCNIEGGRFSIKQLANNVQDDKYRYLLNCHDASYASNTTKFNVTGGSFVNFNPANNQAEGVATNFCAAGYEAVQNDNVWTVQKAPVAKIDDKMYYSLADAIAAVPTDGTETTITLLADVTENAVVKDGKKIVLDLGEKTLTGYIDQYDGELNVKNGTLAGTVYVNGGPASAEAGYNKFTLAADATITADWGFILYQGPNGNDAYGSVIDINGTVNGTAWVMGNIKEGNSVINVNKGAKIEGSVFGLNGLATLNVKEGATIIGSETGIEVRAGNLNVEGGTITSTATEYSVNPNGSGTTTTGAAIAIAQHTTGLPINANIKGGTLSGPKTISVADPQGLNYTDVVVTAKDELTEKENNVIPDGYIWMSNNNGTSTLTKIEDGEYKLIDRVDYPFMNLKSDISVPEVTYQRSFSKTQVDKHQAWYVPMDYTITAEDAKNFTFYKLHMVAGAAEAGEADPNQIYLYVTPMNVGEKLVGNRPYTVKPKAAKENYKFTAENTILYAPNNGSRLNVTTSTHSYDFFGQYENTNYSGNKGDMYYLSQGALHPNNPTTPLLPYRWNIKVSSNSTNDGYAKIGFIIIEDEEATSINTVRDFNADEVEGIYSINGKKLNTPVKGINIIKYKNGKTEKRLIK